VIHGLALIAILCALGPSVDANDNDRIRTILAKSRRAYELLESYEGSGVLEFTNSAGESYHTKDFRIFFRHPGKIRFEWTEVLPNNDLEDHRVLWSNGENTFHYWKRVGQYKEEHTPVVALAGVNFISGGVSRTVPLLLLREFQDTDMFQLEDKQLLPEEEFEGTVCSVVSGMNDGQDDDLIRKIEKRQLQRVAKAPEGVIVLERITEIHRDIRMNLELPEDTFEFNPGEDVSLTKQFTISP
jgi:outer membrane lipoprotein-sorting protein